MIEKERLQELIEQKATIWHDDYGEIKLNKDCEICKVTPVICDVVIGYVLCGKSGEYKYELDIEELEEDIESEKWKYEMHTSRTEKFEPPTWEEFERQHKPYHFISKCGLRETIYIFDKNINNKLLSAGSKFFGKPSKENYEKAVEYARKLFLGVEDE